MPCSMLYGSRLRGYTPYAHMLRSGLGELIILRMDHKRKLANCLSYSEYWINFYIIYYSLYMLIMQVYYDSNHMRDFDPMPDSDRKIWLQSYILTPVDVTTSDISSDSSCTSQLWSMSVPLSYHLSYKRFCMTGLDDCSILQPRHLVWNILGWMYDSINI
jgi:hypothetical protein